ncbi:MAG TPA: hypothetical protein VML50_13365, partial [Anaeromyxobacter sp.]|nr:hypothetical protein [Anaeromyxobacter sp.]
MRHLLTLAAATLLLAACGKSSSPDTYLQSVPDAQGLTLEIKGTAQEGLVADVPAEGVATAAIAVPGGDPTPTTDDDLADAQAKIKDVNQAIKAVFGQVEAAAATGGTPQPGDVKVYGPAQRCVVETTPCPAGDLATFTLTVKRYPLAFGFLLSVDAAGTPKPVMVGWMARGVMDRRGVGQLAVNLENLRAAVPSSTDFGGHGYFLAGFANGPIAKSLVFKLVGFTMGTNPPATVAFRGFKTAAGTSRVRVAGIKDLVAGSNPNPDELGLAHLVYNPLLGGRAFSVVTNFTDASGLNGDVPNMPDGTTPAYYFSRSCYAAAATTPKFKEWFLCPRSQTPFACLGGTAAAWRDAVGTQVAGTAGTTWSDSCALTTEPAEFQAPAGPGATPDPSDASAEPGDSSGLTPQDPPAPA